MASRHSVSVAALVGEEACGPAVVEVGVAEEKAGCGAVEPRCMGVPAREWVWVPVVTVAWHWLYLRPVLSPHPTRPSALLCSSTS